MKYTINFKHSLINLLVALLIMSFYVISCKEKEPEIYNFTISGVLLDSCNGSSLPNVELLLYIPSRQGGTIFEKDKPQEDLDKIVTNSDGTFNFQIAYRNPGLQIQIRHNETGGASVLLYSGALSILEKTDYDLGELSLNGVSKDVRLSIFKTGSAFDINDRVVFNLNNAAFNQSDTIVITKKTTEIVVDKKLVFCLKQIDKDVVSVNMYYSVAHFHGTKRELYNVNSNSLGYCDSKLDSLRIVLDN